MFFILGFYTFLFNMCNTIFCKFAVRCPVWDIDQLIASVRMSPIANEICPVVVALIVAIWIVFCLIFIAWVIARLISYPCVPVWHLPDMCVVSGFTLMGGTWTDTVWYELLRVRHLQHFFYIWHLWRHL